CSSSRDRSTAAPQSEHGKCRGSVRLVLVLRDRLDDLVRDPAARLEEVGAGLIRVREPVLGRVVEADPLNDLSLCLCYQNPHFPPTARRPDPRNERLEQWNQRSFRTEKKGPCESNSV